MNKKTVITADSPRKCATITGETLDVRGGRRKCRAAAPLDPHRLDRSNCPERFQMHAQRRTIPRENLARTNANSGMAFRAALEAFPAPCHGPRTKQRVPRILGTRGEIIPADQISIGRFELPLLTVPGRWRNDLACFQRAISGELRVRASAHATPAPSRAAILKRQCLPVDCETLVRGTFPLKFFDPYRVKCEKNARRLNFIARSRGTHRRRCLFVQLCRGK